MVHFEQIPLKVLQVPRTFEEEDAFPSLTLQKQKEWFFKRRLVLEVRRWKMQNRLRKMKLPVLCVKQFQPTIPNHSQSEYFCNLDPSSWHAKQKMSSGYSSSGFKIITGCFHNANPSLGIFCRLGYIDKVRNQQLKSINEKIEQEFCCECKKKEETQTEVAPFKASPASKPVHQTPLKFKHIRGKFYQKNVILHDQLGRVNFDDPSKCVKPVDKKVVVEQAKRWPSKPRVGVISARGE
ncbi:hypothetical protein Ciccas_010764 [Cichlidogyrus casuarinus]|uniref:Uncharacterized protein n=1 Tax=Cichlidogyrus casuarinus TaxID=1844966 RepID=A0ABD2PT60_9PLAT